MSDLRLIDEIMTEIRDKNVLGELEYLCLSKESLEELKNDYKDEFSGDFFEQNRNVSVKDLEDYFMSPIVVSNLENGKKYKLLTKI